MKVLKDLKELARGLTITGKHLGTHAITIQYPEEKRTLPERSRGIVVLLSDKETGELNCTACLLCEKACPCRAIQITAPRNPETKKRELQQFIVDHTICCFCGLCEEACNFSAIKLATKYEFSTENKEDLIWDIKKLQEVGLDVPYEDTRKKKQPAAAKSAAAAKPAGAKPAAADKSAVKKTPTEKAPSAKAAESPAAKEDAKDKPPEKKAPETEAPSGGESKKAPEESKTEKHDGEKKEGEA